MFTPLLRAPQRCTDHSHNTYSPAPVCTVLCLCPLQKQLHEERVAALLADRQLRAQEEERQRTNLLVQVEALSKQVKQLEDALQTTTRDYITGVTCFLLLL